MQHNCGADVWKICFCVCFTHTLANVIIYDFSHTATIYRNTLLQQPGATHYCNNLLQHTYKVDFLPFLSHCTTLPQHTTATHNCNTLLLTFDFFWIVCVCCCGCCLHTLTATHKELQHTTATHDCNTVLQHTTATHLYSRSPTVTPTPLQHATATPYCNTFLQHMSATHSCNTPPQHTTATHNSNTPAQPSSYYYFLQALSEHLSCIFFGIRLFTTFRNLMQMFFERIQLKFRNIKSEFGRCFLIADGGRALNIRRHDYGLDAPHTTATHYCDTLL